jgi:hypothetical protein
MYLSPKTSLVQIMTVIILVSGLSLAPRAAAPQGTATAFTYIVNGTTDVLGACTPGIGGYVCPSLRAAVIAANANPGSTIRLTHGAIYNLTIAPSGGDDATTGDLNFTANTTLGFGPEVCLSNCSATIQGSAGWVDRILHIANPAVVNAQLLTIRYGNVTGADGGGILNDGRLSLSSSTVMSNTAHYNGYLQGGGGGGIANTGTLTLTASTVVSNTAWGNNGGGFYNTAAGVAALTDVQILGNHSENGGGILNLGTLTMTGGAVNENEGGTSCSPTCAGGLYNEGWLMMTGTLVSDNTGDTAGLTNREGGVAHFTAITVTHNIGVNGGGLFNRGTAWLDYSTLATNTAYFGAGVNNQGGGVITITYSAILSNTAHEDGGGVYNSTTASLSGTEVSYNSAGGSGGGLANEGVLWLTHGTVQDNTTSGNGGGLENAADMWGGGSATLVDSLVSGNTAHGGGGGLDNSAALTVTHSTVSGNHADSAGGGILNAAISYYTSQNLAVLSAVTVTANLADYEGNGVGDGGGLGNALSSTLTVAGSAIFGNAASSGGGLDNRGVLTLVNSTLSGNQAKINGGGLLSQDTAASAYLNNVTLALNQSDTDNDGVGQGGGIAVLSGLVSARNTLIGQNSDVSSQAPDCSGVLTSDRYNLIQDPTHCTLAGNLVGNITGQDPQLGALQNSGSQTWVHPLLLGSPAIDAGNPTAPGSGLAACLTVDQRGVTRPAGVRCDIGAYEGTVLTQTITFAPLPDRAITSPPFTVAATASSGLAVTFTASGPCTASGADGSTISLTGLGTCQVTAHQAGNDTYSAAPDVTQAFRVNTVLYLPLIER